ncbi:long-chain fatty acid--CoA ligase [Alginatibacterium sediminis]|uniref:Long-chain fatty acid--CoA ligase n=1 Tax=Alginatibacterium sediminis TaxID=2164068 RepID=A0A420EBJ7_9ALTE|nr:long-chain fatty acid--CoA ligase [Alginatibacterium sediminis]RKF18023.1 long-chain fatty acid--CoA ligase [Alginatibacterium sediminis]
MLNLASGLERIANIDPEKTAVVCGPQSLSYQQLNAMANQVANGLLELGIQAGDKVALGCPNLPFFPAIYYGILKLGAVVVPLNVLFKAREITYHLRDSEAKAYFCFEGTAELPMQSMGAEGFAQAPECLHMISICLSDKSKQLAQGAGQIDFMPWLAKQGSDFETSSQQADDTAVILYTSGTTGQAKGAELSHSNMLSNAMASQHLMRLSCDDVALVTLPLFHSFGQTVLMNAAILSGSSMVLVPKFDPTAVLTLLDQHGVTVFAGVPTMYIALISAAAQSESIAQIRQNMRLGISGGASLAVEVLEQFESIFDVPILEGYGLSETAPVASFNYPDRPRIAGSVGQAVCGAMIKTVDSDGKTCAANEKGEVLIKGPNVMKGYYKRPEATELALAGGWFHSGDIGRIDEHGNLYIVDRIKEMIVRGGFNVYPREIEEVLMQHPKVQMVAVIGTEDFKFGEEIHAHVIAVDDFSDASELTNWCKERLADYKYPRQFHFRDSLPMTATGKILKRKL